MKKIGLTKKAASFNTLPVESLEKVFYLTEDKNELVYWDDVNEEYLPVNYRIEEFTPDSNSLLFALPAGYKIADITMVNDGTSAGTINVGTTSAGTDILSAVSVGASATVHNSIQTLFDVDADQDIYVSDSSGTPWVDVILTVYVKYERIA